MIEVVIFTVDILEATNIEFDHNGYKEWWNDGVNGAFFLILAELLWKRLINFLDLI
jgi:hypothetical protein